MKLKQVSSKSKKNCCLPLFPNANDDQAVTILKPFGEIKYEWFLLRRSIGAYGAAVGGLALAFNIRNGQLAFLYDLQGWGIISLALFYSYLYFGH